MVACGVEVEGLVTVERWVVVLDPLEEVDRRLSSPLPPLPSSPERLTCEVVVVPDFDPEPPALWLLVPVWVAAPMPMDAPMAPTTPRLARPIWSLLLRSTDVMSFKVPRLAVTFL